uniref:Putative glutathione s-transferase n=1 Tax=Xenopsylla cheopis TaxID=163159 RepID=A0A6M2DCI8_XENCH
MSGQTPVLYMVPLSPPARAVLMTAAAIDVKLDQKMVDLSKGEHKTAEFLKMNPQHTIPVLDDNGFIVWDSHAICAYLLNKYAPDSDLYPSEPEARAHVDQRLHFDSSVAFNRIREMVYPLVMGTKSTIDDDAIANVHEAYAFLEAFLSQNPETPYLAAGKLTIADLCCVSTVSSMLELVPASEDKYPKLFAWFNLLRELPYYKEFNQPGNEAFAAFIKSKLTL